MCLGALGAGQMHGQPSIGSTVGMPIPRYRDYIMKTIFVKVPERSPSLNRAPSRVPSDIWCEAWHGGCSGR
jgi:hypothetical protein